MVRRMRFMMLFVFTLLLFACNGETSTPDSVTPSVDQGQREKAWVDWDYSEVVVMESYPMQVDVIVRGDVPSPCHELRWEIAEPNENNEIHIEVWSVVDPAANCDALLEPFEERFRVGEFTEYGYSIWVNGMQVGEF
jgi:hypothetical protein